MQCAFQEGHICKHAAEKNAFTFVVPLIIYRTKSPNQVILVSLDGVVFPNLVEEVKLKPGFVRTSQGYVST